MNNTAKKHDANRDPITGEPGSHPVGTTVGAAAAGTAGAIVGAGLAGPLGAAVGAGLGVAAGAAVGHNAAETVNPTYIDVEPELVAQFGERDYTNGRPYEDYRDAYAFGAAERSKLAGDRVDWDDRLEANLRTRWDSTRAKAGLAWDDAKHAVRDSWHAVERRLPGDADRDGR